MFSEIDFIFSGTFANNLNLAYQSIGQEQINMYAGGVTVMSAVSMVISTVQSFNISGMSFSNNVNSVPTLAVQSASQFTLSNVNFANNIGA